MKRLVGTVFIFALLLAVMPVFAQEPAVDDPTLPEGAFALLMATLAAIVSTFMGSPLTTLLVNVTKRLPFTGAIRSELIRLVWAAIMTVAFWTIRNLAGDQGVVLFNYIANLDINSLLGILGPIVLNWFLNIVGSAALYNRALDAGDPIFGYQRSAPESLSTISDSLGSLKEWHPS